MSVSMFSRHLPLVVLLGSVATLGLFAGNAPSEPTTFPPEAKERFNQGDELRKKRQYQDAILAFEQAIKLGMANYPRVHLYRAEALQELKQYDAAIADYSQLIDKFGIEESCRY